MVSAASNSPQFCGSWVVYAALLVEVGGPALSQKEQSHGSSFRHYTLSVSEMIRKTTT